MARRKRSLRGLGGSPAHHESKAVQTYNQSSSQFELVKRATTCQKALTEYDYGSFEFGSAATHAGEIALTPAIDRASTKASYLKQDAFSHVVKVCGAKLSGLGRRPRRRR